MRIVVTGSRNWRNPRTIVNRLHQLQDLCATSREELVVGVGDCPTGADLIVRQWGLTSPAMVRVFHADWSRYLKSAGPMRNRRMVDTVRPELVLAFLRPESQGTVDCVNYAESLGIPVEKLWEVD